MPLSSSDSAVLTVLDSWSGPRHHIEFTMVKRTPRQFMSISQCEKAFHIALTMLKRTPHRVHGA